MTTFGHAAVARPDEHHGDLGIGREVSAVGDRSAGDQGSATRQHVVDLGHPAVHQTTDGATAVTLRGITMQDADGEVGVTDVNHLDLAIDAAVHAGQDGLDLRLGDIGGRCWLGEHADR